MGQDSNPNAIVNNLIVDEYYYTSEHLPSYDYVVSSDATGTGDGTVLNPFTIAQANTTAIYGDTIVALAGDTISGTFEPNDDNITYGTYGFGEKAILKGTTPITGWVQHSDSIWRAHTADRFNQLFKDGEKQDLSVNIDSLEYNNRIYMTSRVNDSTFTCTDLIGTDWTGSYVIAQLSWWSFQSFKVIDCNPSTGEITCDHPPLQWKIAEGAQFLMVNSLSNLTEAGQWCLDETKDSVYYWSHDGNAPTGIEASTIADGFVINDVDDITVTGLEIFGFDNEGIAVCNNNSSANDGIKIVNNDFKYNYASAINVARYKENLLWLPTNTEISNNTMIGSSGRSISLKVVSSSITGNTVNETGLLQDIGLDGYVTDDFNGNSGGMSIDAIGSDIEISNNTIDGAGSSGISFKAPNSSIVNNVVKNTCLHLSDAGGIYSSGGAYPSNSLISGNIVLNVGVESGLNSQATHGIYMDAGTDSMTITNNTISTCYGGLSYGMFLSNALNATVTGNTIYNSSVQMRFSQWLEAYKSVNNVVSDNIFYSVTSAQKCATYGLTSELTTDTLELSNNKYYSVQNMTSIEYNGLDVSLPKFKDLTGQEVNGVAFDTLINNYENVTYTSSNLLSNSTFDTNTSGWSAVWTSSSPINTGGAGYKEITSGTQTFLQTWFDNSTDTIEIKFDIVGSSILNIAPSYGANVVATTDVNNYTMYDIAASGHINQYFYAQAGVEGDSIFIDNVSVREVSADYIEPTEKSKLLVNETSSDKYFTLNGIYKDLYGITKQDSILIGDFESAILIKQ